MKYKLVYNRKGKLDHQGKALIQLLIYIDRNNRIYKGSGIKIEPKYWDEKNNLIKRSHPKSAVLNDELEQLVTSWRSFILKHKVNNNDKIDVVFIRALDSVSDSDTLCFIHFFENHVMEISNADLKEPSKASYKRTLKKLKAFNKSGRLPIDQLNIQFCEKFNKWMKDNNLAIRTRGKHFKDIKKAYNVAIRMGYVSYDSCPFKNGFKLPKPKDVHKSISYEQMIDIEKLDVSKDPYLQKVKDAFLFTCYTALRFSDLVRLTYSNFSYTEEGLTMRIDMQKTNKPVEFCISNLFEDEDGESKPQKIIERYMAEQKNAMNAPGDMHGFFKMSNQYYNRRLKQLSRMAKINKSLGSHYGRYTCITVLINKFKLPPHTVQMIAGHSKIETTMGYFNQTTRDINNNLSDIIWN